MSLIKIFFICFINLTFFNATLSAVSNDQFHEDKYIRRVNSHLLIEDFSSAFQEVSEAVKFYPDSRKIQNL